MAKVKQVKAYILKVGGQLLDDARDVIQAEGQDIRNRAVLSAPVNNGKLRQSILTNTSPDRNNVTITAGNIATNTRNYAAFVEFGTGTKVQVPQGFQKMALQFKGQRRTIGMRARPYLIPSYLIGARVVATKLKRLVRNYEMGGRTS